MIAAIEGHAVAGGLELACWADLRLAASDAVLGVFCRRVGVPLIDGGTVRLPRIVGLGRALDLILTGREVGGTGSAGHGFGGSEVVALDGHWPRQPCWPNRSPRSRRARCLPTAPVCTPAWTLGSKGDGREFARGLSAVQQGWPGPPVRAGLKAQSCRSAGPGSHHALDQVTEPQGVKICSAPAVSRTEPSS